jgi:hypothetical protein
MHSSGVARLVHVGLPESGCSQGMEEHETLEIGHCMATFGVDVAAGAH